jgi:hypothetical protein
MPLTMARLLWIWLAANDRSASYQGSSHHRVCSGLTQWSVLFKRVPSGACSTRQMQLGRGMPSMQPWPANCSSRMSPRLLQ